MATASPTGQRSGRPPVGQKGTTPLTGHLLAKRDGEGKKQASPTPHRLTDWRPMPNPLPLSLPMFPILPMWPHNTQKTGEVITASYITTCAAPSRLTHVFGGIFSAFFLFPPPIPPSLFFFHHLKVQENMGNMGSRLITLSLTATFVFPCF